MRFLGDGEMDEPESRGAISFAAREKLDNLCYLVNCNLQRLDGPVMGNGKIIQELEGLHLPIERLCTVEIAAHQPDLPQMGMQVKRSELRTVLAEQAHGLLGIILRLVEIAKMQRDGTKMIASQSAPDQVVRLQPLFRFLKSFRVRCVKGLVLVDRDMGIDERQIGPE